MPAGFADGYARASSVARGATRILTRADLATLLVRSQVLEDVRAALIDHARHNHGAQRVRANLPSGGTIVVLLPGLMEAIPAYTVKVNAKFPHAVPAIRGIICLHDLQSGELLALLDSTLITSVRTGAAGALAAHALAAAPACDVAVVGAGAQGRELLAHLAELRPIPAVRVYDIEPPRARAFADELAKELSIPIEVTASLEASTHLAGIVLIATWARRPVLTPGSVLPGTHISSMGSDEPGKAEIDAAILRASRLYCDDARLTTTVGALASAGLGPEQIVAEIGALLDRRAPGRTSADELTIFAAVGLPAQDLAVAWRLYQRAVEQDVGTVLDIDGAS